MQWSEARRRYPNQWLVVEAVKARSEPGRREVEELEVVGMFGDGEAALREYLRLHRGAPERELYVVHTDRAELEITERFWPGLRTTACGLSSWRVGPISVLPRP